MDDISEFLLGGQRSPGSMSGIVLAGVAVLLASAMLGYLVWCYIRERRIERRIKQRKERPCGGNIVLPAQVLADTKRKKSSGTLPVAPCETDPARIRRRRHPWKQNRRDSPTPH